MATEMEDLTLLNNAETVCDTIWQLVQTWNKFSKDTVGAQLVRAADSIGANVAESYGRFHYGEKTQFLYYARGSVYETKYWIRRAVKRGLIPVEKAQSFARQLDRIAKSVNAFIKRIRQQRNSTR
jgi:four helix bundle protein